MRQYILLGKACKVFLKLSHRHMLCKRIFDDYGANFYPVLHIFGQHHFRTRQNSCRANVRVIIMKAGNAWKFERLFHATPMFGERHHTLL